MKRLLGGSVSKWPPARALALIVPGVPLILLTLSTIYNESTYLNNLHRNLRLDVNQQNNLHHSHLPRPHICLTDDEWRNNDNDNDILPPVTADFPYPLTCRRSELYNFLQKNGLIDCEKGGHLKFKVILAYHIGMVNNWKVIVEDQMNTLKECGLFDIVDGIIVSYSNGHKSDINKVLGPMIGDNGNGGSKIIDTVKATAAPWEGPAMNMIHQYCTKQPLTQPTVVFYIHNKGASKWTPDWKDLMNANKTWTYGHSLYWRKYLEHFLIERPELCLDKILLQNASTCGANWHHELKDHYSGNFWSASCNHIIQHLKPMASEDSGYTNAEFWLGKYEERKSNQEQHANLHFVTENLYEHIVLPEEYNLS